MLSMYFLKTGFWAINKNIEIEMHSHVATNEMRDDGDGSEGYFFRVAFRRRIGDFFRAFCRAFSTLCAIFAVALSTFAVASDEAASRASRM